MGTSRNIPNREAIHYYYHHHHYYYQDILTVKFKLQHI